MPSLLMGPWIWGQATGSNPSALAPLALRRWCASLTLSSPEAVPSLFGLWSWLLGMAALLILALIFQGPTGLLRQLFDLPGHLRLLSSSLDRLRHAGRMVAVTVGATVISWTVSQTLRFNDPRGLNDLLQLIKARSLGELALEQGVLAALTPVRDVFGLGDNLLLLLLATAVQFRVLTERSEWPRALTTGPRGGVTASGWSNLIWGATALYAVYRLVSRVAGTGGLPLGGCLMLEVAVVPLMMALSDGALLAAILVELRSAQLGDADSDVFDPYAVIALWPGAVVACLLTLPGRYVAAAVWLGSNYLPASLGPSPFLNLLRWLSSWGVADLQGAALMAVGLAGALAWSRGSPLAAGRAYLRLLGAEGGRLVALLLLAGLAAGCGSAPAYLLVLSLPNSPWTLSAADGYAHYATLPVGLLTVAALVELGERTLPSAALVGPGAPGESSARLRREPVA